MAVAYIIWHPSGITLYYRRKHTWTGAGGLSAYIFLGYGRGFWVSSMMEGIFLDWRGR